MNIGINARVYTHNEDTEVRIAISAEYSEIKMQTFTDPEAAAEHMRDLIFAKYEEGLREVEKRRRKLISDLTKAQATLERSGAA